MEIVKKRILIEDFINRNQSYFEDIDGTNSNSDGEKTNIWGKIPMDIIIAEDEELFKIGMQLVSVYDLPDDVDSENIVEWKSEFLNIENIGKYYYVKNETDVGEEIEYKILRYNNILPLVDGDEYTYENGGEIISKKHKVLKYQTLMSHYHLLNKLRLKGRLYYRCNNRFFEVENDEVYDDFYEFIYNKNAKIKINDEEDIIIGEIDDADTIDFREVGFYNNINSIIDDKYMVVYITEYADAFNSVFRCNTEERYECLLWDKAEIINGGTYDGGKHNPFIDIPLFISEDINSVGVYETLTKMWDPEKIYFIGDIVLYTDSNSDVKSFILKNGEKLVYNEITNLSIYDEMKNCSTLYTFKTKTEIEELSFVEEGVYSGDKLYEDGKRCVVYENGVMYLPTLMCTKVPSENNKYWEIYQDENLVSNSVENETHGVQSESRINSVRVNRQTSDEDGNILPFNICEDYASSNVVINEYYELQIEKLIIDGSEYSNVICESVGETTEYILFRWNEEDYNYIHEKLPEEIAIKFTIKECSDSSIIGNEVYIKESDFSGNTGNNSSLNVYGYWWDYNGQAEEIYRCSIMSKYNERSGVPVRDLIYYDKCVDGTCTVEKKIDGEESGTIFTTELLYRVGVAGFYMKSKETDNIYADCIDSIVIRNIENENSITWEYDYGTDKAHKKINGGDRIEVNKPIRYGDVIQGDNTNFKKGMITITYRIGALVDEERGENGVIYKINPQSGVLYSEMYDIENMSDYFNYIPSTLNEDNVINQLGWVVVDEDDVDVDIEDLPSKPDDDKLKVSDIGTMYKEPYGDEERIVKLLLKLYYLNIDYESRKTNINGIDMLLSNLSYGADGICMDNFIYGKIVKEELSMGVEDMRKSIDLNIERGISAAFERHHILTEVNTFQDLENYRNDFFNLRQQKK